MMGCFMYLEQEPSTALIPLTESKIKKQSRNLEPLDDVNHKYESLLEERKQMPVPDMIAHNIVSLDFNLLTFFA